MTWAWYVYFALGYGVGMAVGLILGSRAANTGREPGA